MAIDKEVRDYVNKKVDEKLKAFVEAKEAEDKKQIATAVELATSQAMKGITGRLDQVEKRAEFNERSIRQQEFVVFSKRGHNLGTAMIKAKLESVLGPSTIARVQFLKANTFRVFPSVGSKSYEMVQSLSLLNKSPATSLPFYADISRTKLQQAERKEQRSRFEEKRVHATISNYSLAQLEEIVSQRKKDEVASAKRDNGL